MSPWLISEETGEPFTNCIRCAVPLAELVSPWLVNKDYAGGECVMEYAICQGCRDEVAERFSEESREGVRKFLETEVDWEARVAGFMMESDVAQRFARCIACGTEREKTQRFAISALFAADGHLVTGALPLMICGGCVGRMTAGLSDESRQVWRDFIASHFWGPDDEFDDPLGLF